MADLLNTDLEEKRLNADVCTMFLIIFIFIFFFVPSEKKHIFTLLCFAMLSLFLSIFLSFAEKFIETHFFRNFQFDK